MVNFQLHLNLACSEWIGTDRKQNQTNWLFEFSKRWHWQRWDFYHDILQLSGSKQLRLEAHQNWPQSTVCSRKRNVASVIEPQVT